MREIGRRGEKVVYISDHDTFDVRPVEGLLKFRSAGMIRGAWHDSWGGIAVTTSGRFATESPICVTSEELQISDSVVSSCDSPISMPPVVSALFPLIFLIRNLA